MKFEQVKALVEPDMQSVNARIIDQLSSDVTLVNQLGYYIVNSGGKRLRPLLLILCTRALGYSGNQHINLAAVIEFIHTATLLHDDVVDESDQRRGNDTANALFGNAASVLVGDYLYSRAFQMMVESSSLAVMELLANTTNKIAEGEVMQLMNCNDPDTSVATYLEVIEHKTATLFEAATRLAGILCSANEQQMQALGDYGLHLGNAFQMVDDALDYAADAKQLGKNLGDDLAEGKPTMPLILALQKSTGKQQELIRKTIQNGDREQFDTIKAIITDTGALEATHEAARQEIVVAKRALEILPESDYRTALQAIANLAVERGH